LGSRQLEQLIADANADKGGNLNVDELASLVAKVAEQEGGVASLVAKSAEDTDIEENEEDDDEDNFDDDDLDMAKMLMNEDDADEDGRLSAEDVLKLFASGKGPIGRAGLSTERMEQLIAEVDKDGDGGLSVDELASLVALVVQQ